MGDLHWQITLPLYQWFLRLPCANLTTDDCSSFFRGGFKPCTLGTSSILGQITLFTLLLSSRRTLELEPVRLTQPPIIPASSTPLGPNQEQERRLSYHQTPTLHNPPDMDINQIRLMGLAQQYVPTPPQRQYNLTAVQNIHQSTSLRPFRFNSLPNDIILHIFYQGTFFSPENRLSPQMPLLYSKVCKKWRTLAHEASWLWTFIAFRENTSYDLIHHFIKYSQSAPLIVEINITNPRFDYEDDELWPEEDHLDEVMSILLPHAHRWRSFLCCTDNWNPLAGVISLLDDCEFPGLKRLDLVQNFPPDDPSEVRSPEPIFTTPPPSLSQLRLTGVGLDWLHLSTLRFNLTELTIQELPFEDERPSLVVFYNILKVCRNLRKLSIVNSGPLSRREFPGDFPPISFPNLQHFDFRGGDGDGFGLDYLNYLLEFIEFGSSLRTLTIGHFLRESNFDRVIPVLSSRFSQVECLHFGHMPMTYLEIARWLNIFSNLNALYLFGDNIQAAACQVLCLPANTLGIHSTHALCPALKTLSPFCARTSLAHIVVAERAKMGVPLNNLAWDINQREEVEELPYLPYLRRMVRMVYEGEVMDPKDAWVGPYADDMDVEDDTESVVEEMNDEF